MQKERVVLLDTSAIMYRAFYANPYLKTKNEPTGAVYGFLLILQKIIKEFSPKMIGAAFDVTRSSLKRTEMYSEYKAQRESAPEDLLLQIPRIEELLDYYNIKKVKVSQHEADDVLGTLGKNLSNEGYEVIIVTGDKDLSQIIKNNSGIKIALLGKGDGKDPFKILATEDDVYESLGVKPCEIPDFFGLIGDSSDGIPGVRKIGPKKAVVMIEKYRNLEGIYENIDKLIEIPGVGKSLINNLIEDKEIAFISRKLATIDENIQEINDLVGKDFVYKEDTEKLLSFYKNLEFKTMINRLTKDISDENILGTTTHSNDIKELEYNGKSNYDESINLNINFKNYEKIKVDSEKNYKEFIKDISENRKLALYLDELGCVVSTREKDYYFSKIKEGVTIQENECNKLVTPQLFNISSLKENNLESNEELLKNQLKWLKESLNIVDKVISYNIKNIYKLGVDLKNKEVFDILIGYHLITSSTKGEIENYSNNFLNIELLTYKEQFLKKKLDEISSQELFDFLSLRGRILFESEEVLELRLKEEDLYEVMRDVETPLIEILANMELNGIKIDINHFKELNKEFSKVLSDIEEKIYLEAGVGTRREFNINSPKQLGELLFIELSLPIIKKNKTGPSTDVDVLEELSSKGIKIADYLLQHRKITKLVKTYIEPLPKLVDKKNRIHTSFNQIGTTTGRLSSSNPNLQNIPVKTQEGIRIREGFVAESGKKLIGIDYSQIELRVLAELSQDENLVTAYNKGIDLHELTAKKIFELKEGESVTREQRTIAKIINFSIIYGKTPFGLSKELKISQKDASNYIKAYFEQYPKVKEFEQEIIKFCEKEGYVKTHYGRKRWIDGINSRNKNIKMQGERMAVNAVIQGTAAEILKKAMIKIYKEIKDKCEIKMILQVHDELIFEVDNDVSNEYKEKLEFIMREAVEFNYSKLDVKGEIGYNWGDIK